MDQRKLYNEETKERFLSSYPGETQIYYRRIFMKSSGTEKVLNKDLYDFNRQEIINVLYDLAPLTLAASQTNGRIVTAYITWAIEQGLTQSNINHLRSVTPDWFNQFVDKNVQLYFPKTSKDKISLQFIEDSCKNDQDAVIFRLLFEGVNGTAASEIRNLRKQDVDFDTGYLHLRDDNGEERDIKVSEECLRLLRLAINQKIYYKKNGEMDDSFKNVRGYTDLIESDHVIKNSKTRVTNYDVVDKHLIYRRIASIGEFLEVPHLTTKTILRSGMIHMAKQLYEQDGVLDKKQYQEIADRFKVVNWYTIKQFCTLETIENLYGKTENPS